MTQQQPPSEPQQHPCRCETCECGKKRVRILYQNGEEKTRLVKCSKLNQVLTHEEVNIVSLVGCCSHPANTGAQARIDAVVEELEARLDQSKSQQSCFTLEEGARADGYESGLESAIALLEEGVGK